MQAELVAYIKPREFTFCSRCGNICRNTDEAFMCISCVFDLFGSSKKLSQLEMDERLLKRNVEIAVSDICKEYRKDLAELRKGSDDSKST